MVKMIALDLNPENEWVNLPRWKKKLRGFASYVTVAFMSLWAPEATDMVMYCDLKSQFIEKEASSKEGFPEGSHIAEIKAYLFGGYGHCMFCKSPLIEGERLEADSDYAWQNIYCPECGSGWTDQYTLTGVTNVSEGKSRLNT